MRCPSPDNGHKGLMPIVTSARPQFAYHSLPRQVIIHRISDKRRSSKNARFVPLAHGPLARLPKRAAGATIIFKLAKHLLSQMKSSPPLSSSYQTTDWLCFFKVQFALWFMHYRMNVNALVGRAHFQQSEDAPALV